MTQPTVRTLFVDLAVNRQFVRHLVRLSLVGAFTVEVYPPYRIYCRVAYALLLRAPAAYPHFICVSDPSADMTQNLVNQTFHRQDATRNGDLFPQLFRGLSHYDFPSLSFPNALVFPPRGHQRFQWYGRVQRILFPRGLDVALAVFL